MKYKNHEFRMILEYYPVLLALFAGIFAWSITALGAAMVFSLKRLNKKYLI